MDIHTTHEVWKHRVKGVESGLRVSRDRDGKRGENKWGVTVFVTHMAPAYTPTPKKVKVPTPDIFNRK